MTVLSTLLDLLLHRPRGISGKGMPSGQAGQGRRGAFGPMDAPGEGAPEQPVDGTPKGYPEYQPETEQP